MLQHMKRQVKLFEMQCVTMFINVIKGYYLYETSMAEEQESLCHVNRSKCPSMSEVQIVLSHLPGKKCSPNDDESICATFMFGIKFLQIKNPCFAVFMLQIGKATVELPPGEAH